MCSTPDIEVLVEPTVGGGGLLLSQGVVFHDTPAHVNYSITGLILGKLPSVAFQIKFRACDK